MKAEQAQADLNSLLSSGCLQTEYQDLSHKELRQSMESASVGGPSFMLPLVIDQRCCTKELFKFWMDIYSSSKATLVLALQTIQNRHTGAASRYPFVFFHTKGPLQLSNSPKHTAAPIADGTPVLPQWSNS